MWICIVMYSMMQCCIWSVIMPKTRRKCAYNVKLCNIPVHENEEKLCPRLAYLELISCQLFSPIDCIIGLFFLLFVVCNTYITSGFMYLCLSSSVQWKHLSVQWRLNASGRWSSWNTCTSDRNLILFVPLMRSLAVT